MKKNRKAYKASEGDIVFNYRGRYIAILVFFSILLLLIVIRLYKMQVISHEKYVKSLNNHVYRKEISPKRGEIFFSGKDELEVYPVAVNRTYYTAYINPQEVKEKQRDEVATKISEISALNISKEKVSEKLNKINDKYEVITHKITKKQKEDIEKKNILGLNFEKKKLRFYPGDTLASSVIGFVGQGKTGYQGKYGIESYFEKELRGVTGFNKKDKKSVGWFEISDNNYNYPRNGTDLKLSIDYNVQQEVEKILKEDTEKYDAEESGVIVMNPKTGDVISMANIPTFSLNNYNFTKDILVFNNPMVSYEYEPGSVMKTITLAIGLDTKKITPYTTYIDKGEIDVGGYKIKNSEGKVYGEQTMTQVLEKSINTGSIYVERLIGNKKFREYLDRFGFGRKTGIELPTEINGNLRNLNNFYRNTEFDTASFGHGMTATPIQLITAYSALANKGNMMKPRIVVEKIQKDIDGKKTVKKVDTQFVRKVVSEDVSKKISKMLEKVVTGGHAKLAGVKGYRVGGKTGTAQIVKSSGSGYKDDDFKIATFIGYAPIEDPKFVILVKYKNPKNAEWAATSAAPTFSRIAKFLFNYYGIMPTESIEK